MRQRIALMGLAAGNIVVGLLYTLAVIKVRGVGSESDAFFFTTALSTFFLAVFSGPISSVVTAGLAASQSQKEWRALAWAGHVSSCLIYLPIACLVLVSADFWLDYIMPSARDVHLYREILAVQMAAMFFSGLQVTALAAVQSRKMFLLAEAVLLGTALFFYFPFVLALQRYGVVEAAEVQLLRVVVLLLVLLVFSGAPVWRGLKETAREFAGKFRLPVLGGAYYKTDALLDRYLLAHANDGVMTVYHLVQQVITIISTLYARSFMSPLLVRVSEDFSEGRVRQLGKRIKSHLGMSLYIMLACLFMTFVGKQFAYPIGELMRLSPLLLSKAAGLFMVLGGVLLGGLMGQAINTVFYATGRLSIAVWTGVISYTLFVPLKVLGFMLWGVNGLAMVASLYYMVNALVLFVLQSRLLKEYVS